MTKEVLFIRHGESVTNGTNIYQAGDQFEIDPLNEAGEKQVESLAKKFQGDQFEPEVILSSSYLRATQTARAIAKVTLDRIVIPVIKSENETEDSSLDQTPNTEDKSLFRELDLPSELEGRSFDDEAAVAIKEQINEHRYEPNWHFSDEENLYDAWNRAKLCLDYLASRAEQRIVVVTHGGLIKACLARMLFDDEKEFSTPEKLEAYHAFAASTWYDNTGIASTMYDEAERKWKWLISGNDHLPGPFGYVRKEQTDTSADQLLNRDE